LKLTETIIDFKGKNGSYYATYFIANKAEIYDINILNQSN